MSEFTFAAQRRLQEVVEAPQEAEVLAPGGAIAAAAGAAREEGPTLQVSPGHEQRTAHVRAQPRAVPTRPVGRLEAASATRPYAA